MNDFTHYAQHRTCINTNAKRNSGGIVVYIKEYLAKHVTLYSEHSDQYMWLKFPSTIFNTSHDLYMCTAYIIPENSSRQAFIESNIFDDILDDMCSIQNATDGECTFMLLGDLNSRCGSLFDFVAFDHAGHVGALPDDYVCDTELPRMSQDNGINSNGRSLIELCKASGLRIANGRVCNEPGKCTYVSSNGKSMVDLVLTDHQLLHCFFIFVDDPNILSDHCIVHFSMSCSNYQHSTNNKSKRLI